MEILHRRWNNFVNCLVPDPFLLFKCRMYEDLVDDHFSMTDSGIGVLWSLR